MCTEARRRRDRPGRKKKTTKTTKRRKKKTKRPYSVCPGGTERVASVFVGNAGRGREGANERVATPLTRQPPT